jgi:hypothetical protein
MSHPEPDDTGRTWASTIKWMMAFCHQSHQSYRRMRAWATERVAAPTASGMLQPGGGGDCDLGWGWEKDPKWEGTVFIATLEFCHTLGETPTYRLASNQPVGEGAHELWAGQWALSQSVVMVPNRTGRSSAWMRSRTFLPPPPLSWTRSLW